MVPSGQQLKLVEEVNDDADVAGHDALLAVAADEKLLRALPSGSASTTRSSSVAYSSRSNGSVFMFRSSSCVGQQLKLVEVVREDADVAGHDALLTLDADDAEEPGATATGSASTLRSSSME